MRSGVRITVWLQKLYHYTIDDSLDLSLRPSYDFTVLHDVCSRECQSAKSASAEWPEAKSAEAKLSRTRASEDFGPGRLITPNRRDRKLGSEHL
jgi:hypothetical protein